MKNIVLFACTTIFLFACKTNKENSTKIKKLNAYLTAQATHNNFNGNVLVAENGEMIFQGSYGFANFETKRILNDSSVFELASISKQFTATAILLLKDKAKLKLTDSLRQYFPELPYSGISIYQMLTHTSGLPDYESAMIEKWNQHKIAFNNDMIAFLSKEKPPVLFNPGTQWQYSNTAYAILASIVEKVSGQPFNVFMKQNIFKPLNMNHTRIYNTRRSLKDTIANYAYGFVYDDSLKKHLLPDSIADLKFVIYLDGLMGDGVVNSTTADLLKWDRSIKNHTLLNEATQKEMLKEQAMVDTAKNSHYGFGVFMEKSAFGYIVSHSGGWPGYTTYLARNVDKDQTFIVLSNNQSPSPAIATALQNILNGNPVEMAYEHKQIIMDTLTLQQFVGKYKTTNEINIERNGNKLFRVSANGQKIELKPESATKFFYTDGSDRQIEFELDASKKIVKAWLINYGVKTDLVKI